MLLVVNKSSWHAVGAAIGGIGVTLTQPFSRGSVRLSSSNPAALPEVRFRMLTDPRDFERYGQWATARLGAHAGPERPATSSRTVRGRLLGCRAPPQQARDNERSRHTCVAAVLDAPDAIRRTILKYGVASGDIEEGRMRDQGWLENTIRRHAFGTYHPTGTCRMGSPSDPGSVVDAGCAVHGVDGLSVVDASIMPTVPRGNTNIPVTMVAERAAERITQKGDTKNTFEPKHSNNVVQSPDDY